MSKLEFQRIKESYNHLDHIVFFKKYFKNTV